MPKYGKLGRRKADPAKYNAIIRLPLTGVMPAYPLTADHLKLIARWMLGANDRYGTCGPVAVANFVVMVWKYCLGEDITVEDADVFDLYRRSGNPNFNPDTGADDNGVDMTVLMDALLKGGIWITHDTGRRELVKPLCYATIPLDMATQRAVTSILGGVLWGVDLQVAQQSQTDFGLWDYAPSAEWGGHAIMGGKYTSKTTGEDERIVSWRIPIGTTDAFADHQLGEAYIPVFRPTWDNPAFQAGVDQAMLAAAYEAATGRSFPVPLPEPTGTGVLTGVVTDAKDGHAISGATVNVGTPGAISDGEGIYRITGLAEGIYTLVAYAGKYKTLTIPGITVQQDQTATQDVALEPQGSGCALSAAAVLAICACALWAGGHYKTHEHALKAAQQFITLAQQVFP